LPKKKKAKNEKKANVKNVIPNVIKKHISEFSLQNQVFL
jgi:hypothetical protein